MANQNIKRNTGYYFSHHILCGLKGSLFLVSPGVVKIRIWLECIRIAQKFYEKERKKGGRKKKGPYYE